MAAEQRTPPEAVFGRRRGGRTWLPRSVRSMQTPAAAGLSEIGISPRDWSSRARNPSTPPCAKCARKPRSTTLPFDWGMEFMETGPVQQGQDLPLLPCAQQGNARCSCRSIRTWAGLSITKRAGWTLTRRSPWCRRGCMPVVRWATRSSITSQGLTRGHVPGRSRRHRRRRRFRRSRGHVEITASEGRATSSPCEICSCKRQRPLHRQAPAAEVGGRRSGRGILEYRAALRKEETRQRAVARAARGRTRRPC